MMLYAQVALIELLEKNDVKLSQIFEAIDTSDDNMITEGEFVDGLVGQLGFKGDVQVLARMQGMRFCLCTHFVLPLVSASIRYSTTCLRYLMMIRQVQSPSKRPTTGREVNKCRRESVWPR